MENVDGMKFGKHENPEKTQIIPTLSTTILLLAAPRLKLGTSVGTDERSNRLYAGTVVSLDELVSGFNVAY